MISAKGRAASWSSGSKAFATGCGHNVHMTDRNILTLRQADQARTDFALLESNLESIAAQLAKTADPRRSG
jgi:hypothetical protein